MTHTTTMSPSFLRVVSLVPWPCYAPRHKGYAGGLKLIRGKMALNIGRVHHYAVLVLNNRSTGRFEIHLAPLPLVRESGDQAKEAKNQATRTLPECQHLWGDVLETISLHPPEITQVPMWAPNVTETFSSSARV